MRLKTACINNRWSPEVRSEAKTAAMHCGFTKKVCERRGGEYKQKMLEK